MNPDTEEPRLFSDIRNQPESLVRVLQYQLGEGSEALAAAAEGVRQTRRVVLTGMGSSLYACLPLQYFLVARGFLCEVIAAGELAHYLHPAARNAALVMVSRSGESVEVTNSLRIAAKCATVTIGVTNEPASSLAGDSRYPVLVSSCVDEMVAVQTYTGTLLLLMLLGYLAAGEPERVWRPGVENAIVALGEALLRGERESQSWREFLSGASSLYLLARGPSLGSALEGALLFNEVAKISSTAMSAGDFRHGPVEIASGDFRGLIFAPDGPTSKLNHALALDLQSFGGSVRIIGPADDDRAEGFWRTAHVPDSLAPLVEIAPVQWAAVRLAQWRGIMPGRLRYVSQVTTSELAFEQLVSQQHKQRRLVRADQ